MTDTNIDIIQDTKQKIIKLLTPSGWADKLRTFLTSQDMDVLLEKLLQESKEGRNFTPTLKDVFNAFIKCPFDSMRAVIIGQDPYPQFGVADGVAFSCSKVQKPQASLRYIFNSLERQTGVVQTNLDLSRWSEQGLLLINSAFTCQLDKPGSHKEIWNDFMFMVIDAINFKGGCIPVVLMGKYAQAYAPYITQPIILSTHPAAAAYAKANEWDNNDCFNKINEALKDNPIVW